jgi:signal transduction histidine kinase
MVAITVENDGRPFTPGNAGSGLKNMWRRAQQLRGDLQIRSQGQGVRLTLMLPARLPDFQVEPELDSRMDAKAAE